PRAPQSIDVRSRLSTLAKRGRIALNDLKRRLARMRSPEPRLPQLHRNFIGARSVESILRAR
ncbi:MAG TPA: hypothetical protein VIJ87_12565, partial [Pyrinomonadaceae bacterium]